LAMTAVDDNHERPSRIFLNHEWPPLIPQGHQWLRFQNHMLSPSSIRAAMGATSSSQRTVFCRWIPKQRQCLRWNVPRTEWQLQRKILKRGTQPVDANLQEMSFEVYVIYSP
jgi:hypothetical protein